LEVDWITVKQSAELNNLLHASPGTMVLAEAALLLLLSPAARCLSRKSAIAASVALCPASLIVLALSAFPVRENLKGGVSGSVDGMSFARGALREDPLLRCADYIGIDNYYPMRDTFDYAPVVETIERAQSQFNKPDIVGRANQRLPHSTRESGYGWNRRSG